MPLFDQLYKFAHWLTRDRSEAEDLVQQTYTKALRGFSSFQTQANFRSWMYRILRNTFLTSRSALKANMTGPRELDEDILEVPLGRKMPEEKLIERSNWQLIQRAIGELPLHSREVLLLCDLEAMSYREICETLSIPVGAVMSRLSRARNALAELVLRKLEGGAVNGLRDLENTTRSLS